VTVLHHSTLQTTEREASPTIQALTKTTQQPRNLTKKNLPTTSQAFPWVINLPKKLVKMETIPSIPDQEMRKILQPERNKTKSKPRLATMNILPSWKAHHPRVAADLHSVFWV
jgi:hypothetical protein